jgi:hypothetical protein
MSRRMLDFGKIKSAITKWASMGRPYSAEWGQWDSVNARCRKQYPIRWFVLETLPDWFGAYVSRPISAVVWWIKYRTTDRYHVLNIRSLPPGYADADTRLLHAAFSILVDFVEIEKAWMQRICGVKSKVLWRRTRCFRQRHRDPQSGMQYLEWEAGLDNAAIPLEERNSAQAEAAREVILLYTWWTRQRPGRVDPMEASGWSAFCDLHPGSLFFNRRDPAVAAQSHSLSEKTQEIEAAYEAEDTDMFIRLIKIRGYLWT